MQEIDPAADPKAFLRQIRTLEREIDELEQVKAGLKASLVSVGGMGGSSSGSPDPDRFGRVFGRIEAVEARIDARIDEKNRVIDRAVELIERVHDSTQRSVLRRRYLLGQKWDEIAREFHYDERTVFRIHGAALKAFRESCQ